MFQRCVSTAWPSRGVGTGSPAGRKPSWAWYSELHAGPSRCRRQVSVPCSPVREEALGVGGLYNLAKGVYIKFKLEKQMNAREKPLHTNNIICLTLKGSGNISTRKAVIFITLEEKQMVPHKKITTVKILFFLAFWNLLLITLVIAKIKNKNPLIMLYGIFSSPPQYPFHVWRDSGKIKAARTRACSWQKCEECGYFSLFWLPI